MTQMVIAYCAMLALAGQQGTPDLYSAAIEKYAAGDLAAASEALAQVPQTDIQKSIETAVAAVRSSGAGVPARRRLEAMAMLHTEYALVGDVNPKEALFHVDMAHRSLALSRASAADADEGEGRRAREFLPHWYALAASALLSVYADQNALTLVDEGLKQFPDDRELLLWRGLVLEFHAVWVGTPATDSTAAVPAV